MINLTNPNLIIKKPLFNPNRNKSKRVQNIDMCSLNVIHKHFNKKESKRISFCGLNSGDILRSIYLKLNLSVSQIAIFEKEAKHRIIIPSTSKCCDSGLNQIVGLNKLKQGVYNDILTPLLVFSEHTKISRLNGIMFFGPKGTGKTYFANKMGEHFMSKGGQFEELRFLGNSDKDIYYLERKFADAKKEFIESGRKKYKMFFIDEIEKKFDKNNVEQKPTFNKLLKLSQNSNNNGVILVSTANYLDEVAPEIFHSGQTDLLIPMDYVEQGDLASLINHYIQKDQLPIEKNTNINKIATEINSNGYKYKPKDIERALVNEAINLVDYGGELNDVSLKETLIDKNHEFDNKEYEQFKKDKKYAKSLGIFYNYSENTKSIKDFKLSLLKTKRQLLSFEKEKQEFEKKVIDLKSKLLNISTIGNSIG